MKKIFTPLIVSMTRYTVIGCLFQCLCLNVVLASETGTQDMALSKSVNAVTVEVGFDNASLQEVFNTISTLTDFRFTYHAKEAYLQDRFSFPRSEVKVGGLLQAISASSGLRFKQKNNNISVRAEQKSDKLSTPLEIELDMTISGQVTSMEDGEALTGVNIIVKGTNNGTVTDIDGMFRLNVADPETDVLIFSSVGFLTEEVSVNGRAQINMTLSPDISSLNEVVVVGYGTQTQRELTGAISQVKTKQIAQNINADPVTSLQGNVAGVQLTQASGQPGGAIRIRVRGSSSLLSSGDPLVVVDGIPVITSSFGPNSADGISGLSEINPNDIESMEVLKDGAAAAIYGSRAANGVILITTKRGKAGQSTLNVDYQQGVTTPTNRVDLLNGPGLMAVNRRAWENTIYSGTGGEAYFPIPRNVDGANGFNADVASNTDVNWLDQVLRDGQFRSFNISGSTGSENTSVFASIGYWDEEGIEIGRDFTRANARVKVDHQSSDKLKVGVNLSLAYINRDDPGGHFGTAQSSALPFFPINRPDDPTKLFNGFNETENDYGTNVIFYRNNYSDVVTTYRSISNAYLEFSPLPGLSFRSEWGIDYQSNVGDSKLSQQLFPANNSNAKVGGNGRTNTRRFSSVAWNTNNTINYTRTFNQKHGLTVLVGSSILNQESQGQTFVFENLTFPSLPIGSTFERVSNSQSLFRFISVFSRFNYDYDGKYFVQASARRDGSSRFGPGNKFGNFAGGALGWIVSEENFFKDNISFINFAKLRLSYGTVGNAELPNDFLSISLANVNDSEIGYAGFSGVAFDRIGNDALSWETTQQFNAGLDVGLLNKRINLTFDFYSKLSEDLLLESRLANSTGYLDRNFVFNVGSLRNRGVEFSINTINVSTKNFQWTSGFNISRNEGTVVKLTPPVNADDTQIITFNTGDVRMTEGSAFGAYYLPIWAGVDPTTGNELVYEVDQVYLQETGIARLTGGVLDAEELGGNINRHRMILEDKTAVPEFFGGLSNTFTYKGLNLDVLFYYQYGNYILDNGERAQSYPREQQSLRANLGNALDLPAGEFSQSTPLSYNSSIREVNTTRFLHDASFIRLRNIRLGYDIPVDLISRLGVSRLQIYASGQNLLTFTKFPGWDPEVFSAGGDQQRANASPGSIGYSLPQVKTFLVGLNVRF